jgi:hypothetical protein
VVADGGGGGASLFCSYRYIIYLDPGIIIVPQREGQIMMKDMAGQGRTQKQTITVTKK